MAIADQILSTDVYEKGDWFTVAELAEELGVGVQGARKVLWQMADRDEIEVQQRRKYRPAKFRRFRRHWVWAQRLADTSWMEAGV